jgi:hypothetical protein
VTLFPVGDVAFTVNTPVSLAMIAAGALLATAAPKAEDD